MPEGFSDLLGDLERDLDADLRRLGGTRQKKISRLHNTYEITFLLPRVVLVAVASPGLSRLLGHQRLSEELVSLVVRLEPLANNILSTHETHLAGLSSITLGSVSQTLKNEIL